MSELKPSKEMVDRWFDEGWASGGSVRYNVAARAAQWGADRELEECCRWLESRTMCGHLVNPLCTTRRPAPPSIKAQAFSALASIEGDFNTVGDRVDVIRKALEMLDD